MRETPEFWVERGLIYLRRYLELHCPSFASVLDAPPLVAVLPCALALARRWGSLDPARASGFLATLRPIFLRGALRAAVIEHAAWPPAAFRPALRRAEADLRTLLAQPSAEPARVLELWNGLAVSWARHEPSELPALYARLHCVISPHGAGLWAERIRRLADESSPLPPAGMLPPGDPRRWRRLAEWAPSPVTRARACLALSAPA